MDNGTKVSFIPKKPLSRKTEKQVRPMSLLLFLSFFIFFTTLAVYGGLYLYHATLKVTLDDKIKELKVMKEEVDPTGSINRAEILQAKIKNTKELLSLHIAPSRIFNLLEEVTLKSIVLNGFTLEKESKGIKQSIPRGGVPPITGVSSFIIKTKGTAPSYTSVAYQSDVLKKEVKENKRIKSFSITKLTPNKEGEVSFSLDLVLHTQFLSYGNTIKNVVKKVRKVENKTSKVLDEAILPETEKVSTLDSFLNFFRNRK